MKKLFFFILISILSVFLITNQAEAVSETGIYFFEENFKIEEIKEDEGIDLEGEEVSTKKKSQIFPRTGHRLVRLSGLVGFVFLVIGINYKLKVGKMK